MPELSIIICGVNEWPRLQYTIRAVREEFRDRADFEIVYVDNFPDRPDPHNADRQPDGSWEAMQAAARHIPELRVMEYRDHLSHWVCKRKAVESSTADFFLFLDAHVVPGRDGLYNQFALYRAQYDYGVINGSFHVPTTYHVLENKALQYKMHNELDKGWLGYSFTGHRAGKGHPYRVCCHTTDGCLIHRSVYEAFGGWPEIMTAWGGGENLFNFVLSILGMNKWLMPGQPLYHDGAPRGYAYTWEGLHLINRLIAMYFIGGRKLADRYIANQKGDPDRNRETAERVLADQEVKAQREHIKRRQVIDIETWAANWKDLWV